VSIGLYVKDKGELVNWNGKKGFGFINCESYQDDVFIHISALNSMVRKPRVGDLIYFDRLKDKKGKYRAVYASIKGVATKSDEELSTGNEGKFETVSSESDKLGIFIVVLVLISVFVLYQIFSPKPLPVPIPNLLKELIKKEDFTGFSCQGKQHCSQMNSCKEAKFYLKNCPSVKIDGDRDGVPCERQLCR